MNYIFPLVACLLWGVNTVVTKLAAGAIGPIDISYYRWSMATLILAPFALSGVARNWGYIRNNLARFATLGVLGGVIYQCTAYYAAHFTTATNMGVIQSLIPLLALGLSRLLLGKPVTRLAIVGSIISACGVVVVVSHGDLKSLVAHGLNRGDVFMLLGALAFALYNLLTHRWDLQVSLLESLFLQAASATIALLPLWAIAGQAVSGPAALTCTVFAALGASIAAPLAWMTGIARLGATQVSGFFNLVPIVTAVAAVVVLSETPSARTIAGGALAVMGVVVGSRKSKWAQVVD